MRRRKLPDSQIIRQPSTATNVCNAHDGPIATHVPGIEFCEHLPLQSQLADRFSILRSLHHDVGIHSDGGIVVLTGKRPEQLDPTSQSKSKHSDFGHMASELRGTGTRAIPLYVALPYKSYVTLPDDLGVHNPSFEPGEPSADQ